MTTPKLMAKNAAFEGDTAMAKTELKKELQRLVKSIIKESSSDEANELGFTQCVEIATQILQALKDLKDGGKSKHGSSSLDTTSSSASFPLEFRCPISEQLMRDPVIISSGLTFDRTFIRDWFKNGNRKCPVTQEDLSSTILTPNHLVTDIITQWCNDHGVQLLDPEKSGLTIKDRKHFIGLLTKMSSNLSDQKESAKMLRSLTMTTPSFRAVFGESHEAITRLIAPLSQIENEIDLDLDLDLQEDLITTLFNISIYEDNKKLVAETPMVIPLLIDALRSQRTETTCNSAAALFSLSALDSNKTLIGQKGALKPLLDLLENGNSLEIKDAAPAIFNLCLEHQNKARAVQHGAVRILLNKITNQVFGDELLAILAILSSNETALKEMCDLEAVSCLFSLIKDTNCDRNKENCIAILYAISDQDRTKWKEMLEEERGFGTLSQLAQTGTSRAKRKASDLLNRLNEGVTFANC